MFSFVEAGSPFASSEGPVPVGSWVGVRVDGTAVGGTVGVIGLGVGVSVAGGVTCNTSFCSGCKIEDAFRPFQAIRSAALTS